MKTMKKLNLLVFALVCVALVPAAYAGRGASSASIVDAIASNNADVIASELERAEFLVCGACVAPVLDLLDHDDYRVRQAAAWWLTRRPFLKVAIESSSLMRLQAGTSPVLARNAADVLGTFKHPVVLPALDTAMSAGFPDETTAAIVHAVGTIGSPNGLVTIQRGLRAPGPLTRGAAVQAYLDLRGTRDGMDLVPLLADSDPNVRATAVGALGNYNVASARDQLISLLGSDTNPIVRRNAAWALGRLGDSAARNALTNAAAKDGVSYVRSVADAALRQLY